MPVTRDDLLRIGEQTYEALRYERRARTLGGMEAVVGDLLRRVGIADKETRQRVCSRAKQAWRVLPPSERAEGVQHAVAVCVAQRLGLIGETA